MQLAKDEVYLLHYTTWCPNDACILVSMLAVDGGYRPFGLEMNVKVQGRCLSTHCLPLVICFPPFDSAFHSTDNEFSTKCHDMLGNVVLVQAS